MTTIQRRIAFIASVLFGVSSASLAEQITLPLEKGSMADYGATPWYTTHISLGTSPMQLALDTGTNLFWATLDKCTSEACMAHSRVNTSQPGFSIISNPNYPKKVGFGPWGSMTVDLAKVNLTLGTHQLPDMRFDGSIDYEGEKFQYLSWGGGIGIPSESSSVSPDIDNIFFTLYQSGAVSLPVVSFYTDGPNAKGSAILGGDDPSLYDSTTQVELLAKKSTTPGLNYLWGTNLHKAEVGTTEIPALENGIFYVDSGSSRFKGGDDFVRPILEQLLTYKDSAGHPIFETYSDTPNTNYTGIKYANGKSPQDFVGILPDFSLTIGAACGSPYGPAARISLSPAQYSYKVDVGDRQGEWVAAFHILNGVDGLLVGSTFMDLVYTRFQFEGGTAPGLSQGSTYLYQKNAGERPSGFACVDAP